VVRFLHEPAQPMLREPMLGEHNSGSRNGE
jgi:hypothetical protein